MKLMQFLMGIDNSYQFVRSALLTKNPLHEVKDAYTTVSREESHREILESYSVIESKFNMQKLRSLINETPSESIHANLIINSGANQHLTVSTVGMFDVIYIFNLNITVGHPNGTLATISHVGNLKFTNNVILYDALDLKRETVLGAGSESGGLYLFNMDNDKSVDLVTHDLHLSKSVSVSACETCRRAKQTREPFPLSDHTSKKLGELIHLDS
ncbi:hypothetical protein Tco_1341011 [Tanacetum coccineum]